MAQAFAPFVDGMSLPEYLEGMASSLIDDDLASWHALLDDLDRHSDVQVRSTATIIRRALATAATSLHSLINPAEAPREFTIPLCRWACSSERRGGFTTDQAIHGACSVPYDLITRADQMRAAEILRSIGWQKSRVILDGLQAWRWYPAANPSAHS